MKKDRAVRPTSPAAADTLFGESERHFRQMIDVIPEASHFLPHESSHAVASVIGNLLKR